MGRRIAKAISGFSGGGGICFDAGDMVSVHDTESEDWWLGECNGVTGYFPSCYVVMKSDFNVVALYDFRGSSMQELSFKAGDVLLIVEQSNNDWWYAEFNNNAGFIPTDYVQLENSNNTVKLTTSTPNFKWLSTSAQQVRQTNAKISMNRYDSTTSPPPIRSQNSVTNLNKSSTSVSGKVPFQKKTNNPLSKSCIDINTHLDVQQIKRVQKGPPTPNKATLPKQRAIQVKKAGFPETKMIPVLRRDSIAPYSKPLPPLPSEVSITQTAEALYDYDAITNQELTFRTGDIFTILEQDNAEWFYAKLREKVGFVPRSYVKLHAITQATPTSQFSSNSSSVANSPPNSPPKSQFSSNFSSVANSPPNSPPRSQFSSNSSSVANSPPNSPPTSPGQSTNMKRNLRLQNQQKPQRPNTNTLPKRKQPLIAPKPKLNQPLVDVPKNNSTNVANANHSLNNNFDQSTSTVANFVAIALYDYSTQKEDELTISAGDVITVIHAGTDSEWWYCEMKGKLGYVHKSYLAITRSCKPKGPKTGENVRERFKICKFKFPASQQTN